MVRKLLLLPILCEALLALIRVSCSVAFQAAMTPFLGAFFPRLRPTLSLCDRLSLSPTLSQCGSLSLRPTFPLWGRLKTCGPIVNRPHTTPNLIAWAINRAAPLVPRATCLVRAIAAQHLLARHGHAATVHIGIANSAQSGFEAHAWVECQGAVLVGRTSTPYTPLLNWSAAR